jgi:phosphate transport system substrate-binding protein
MGIRFMRVALLLLTVCHSWPLAQAGELSIPGSGDCEFVLAQLAAAFERTHADAKLAIPASTGSAGGVRSVMERRTVLGRIARALKPEEAAAGIRAQVFGRDAIVFAVGERIKVRSLTETQLAEVFSGRIANWRELGDEPGPLRLIVREESDTSLSVIRARLASFRTLRFDAGAKMVARTPEMIELLARYKTSIGWATLSSLQAGGHAIGSLAVAGVAPGTDSLVNGRYPLSTEYALVYRDDGLTGEAREFLAFVASPAAHGLMHKLGVAPPAGK